MMKIKPILMTIILSLMSFDTFATDTENDNIEQLIKTNDVNKFEKDHSKLTPPYLLIDNPTPVKKPATKSTHKPSPVESSLPKKEFKMTNVKDGKFVTYGTASYYSHQFHGRKTANGEIFNMYKLTAASNTHKFGTKLKVTCMATGKSVVVRVNDTGSFGKKYNRSIDLSYAAAKAIDMVERGVAKVKIEVVS